jgi:RNA polymerase sigma-70 factor (ECF subfamily)
MGTNEAEHAASWDAHAQRIFRYCFRRTGDAVLAEDLTSIVFLEAWRRRDEIELPSEARLPWLYGVATNVLRNQRRNQRRYEAALARLPMPRSEPDFADAADDRLTAEQRMRSVIERLKPLTDIEREVLALCIWEDLGTHEVAAALSIPEATVRTRLHRARARLTETNALVTDVMQGDIS